MYPLSIVAGMSYLNVKGVNLAAVASLSTIATKYIVTIR